MQNKDSVRTLLRMAYIRAKSKVKECVADCAEPGLQTVLAYIKDVETSLGITQGQVKDFAVLAYKHDSTLDNLRAQLADLRAYVGWNGSPGVGHVAHLSKQVKLLELAVVDLQKAERRHG